MAEREKAVRKFRRAAEQRWLAGHWLFEHSEYYHDATYLGGYAVECALKALIFRRTSDRRFAEVYESVTSGKKAHDFEFLKGVLRRKPISIIIPKDVMESFQQVATWSTDLRYESAAIEYDEARAFMGGVSANRAWVEGRL